MGSEVSNDKLFFSQRRSLEVIYRKWVIKNDFAERPMSVISFLQQNGLIDTDKAIDFVEKNSVPIKNPCIACGDEWDQSQSDSCQNCGNEIPF